LCQKSIYDKIKEETNEEKGHQTGCVNALEEKKEGFVSLKVDYAFTYVMKNLKVLRGFISA